MSKIKEAAVEVLRRMAEESVDGLWTGNLSDLVGEIAGSKSYYSPIIRMLKGSQAAAQTRRGGGSSPSIWRILNPEAVLDTKALSPIMSRRKTLESRVEDLERLVGGVNVPQAISDILGGGKEVVENTEFPPGTVGRTDGLTDDMGG